MYELTGVGLDGKEKLFQKPWMMTTLMFVGGCQRQEEPGQCSSLQHLQPFSNMM